MLNPTIKVQTFLASVPLFRDVGTRILGKDTEALAAWLLDELLRAGAVRLESGEIVPTMAA